MDQGAGQAKEDLHPGGSVGPGRIKLGVECVVDRLRLKGGAEIAKKNNGSSDRKRKADITGSLAGLDVSPARYIRQSSVENKITCPNYNNISEQLNGLSWKTVRWVSDRVAVLDKKGKLSRFTRMVLGWVIILEFKRIKFKKK